MITLTSDFGSPYPAAMKGVIKQRCDAELIDITHDLPRQDIQTAAFWLDQLLPTFPPAVHLVVIDPGVGTERQALLAEVGDHVLVGPDNGVLCPVARSLGEPTWYAIDVEDPDSVTFHGRDVFAPAAATIHEHRPKNARTLAGLTTTTPEVDVSFPEPKGKGDHIVGAILAVDGFGNAITNVPATMATERGWRGHPLTVGERTAPFETTYASVEVGDPLIVVGSHGKLELAVNQGRGADAFGVQAGDEITIQRS